MVRRLKNGEYDFRNKEPNGKPTVVRIPLDASEYALLIKLRDQHPEIKSHKELLVMLMQSCRR